MRTLKRLLRTYITWLESLIAEPRPVVSDTLASETVSLHRNIDVADDAVQTSASFATDDHDVYEHTAEGEDESAVFVRPQGFVRVISFLGVGSMNETEYYLEGDASTGIKTRFAGYAAHQLIRADETLFFCTTAAKENYHRLEREHPEFVDKRMISIPEGMTTAEMWQVFAILMEEIIDGDHLIIDISNSFRSLPVMVLAALGFLQEVRNIRIDRLVYGAYDRNAGMRTAMINLQPFVELTTWVNATHSLLHYGQGAELASLMRRITTKKRNPWLRLAVTLSDLNAALQLVQLTGVSALANQLREQVDTLPQELDEQYLPIKQLLNRVADSYAEFQPAIMMRDELLRQQRIIRWYLDHSLYVQAILLAREFLISLAIFRREKMTATVESLASIVYHRDRREAVRLADEFPNGLGRRVTTCRNDLAHPNERWDGKNGIKKTKQEIIELCELVMQLPV